VVRTPILPKVELEPGLGIRRLETDPRFYPFFSPKKRIEGVNSPEHMNSLEYTKLLEHMKLLEHFINFEPNEVIYLQSIKKTICIKSLERIYFYF
jgi:hypothetical protein